MSRVGKKRGPRPYAEAKRIWERGYLLRLLQASGCCLSEAERLSGTHRKVIRDRLLRHGLWANGGGDMARAHLAKAGIEPWASEGEGQ